VHNGSQKVIPAVLVTCGAAASPATGMLHPAVASSVVQFDEIALPFILVIVGNVQILYVCRSRKGWDGIGLRRNIGSIAMLIIVGWW